ncbi:MAG: LamG-like jellyroll fold domain-containing protein [Algibacter sp.]|uniref:LamG-like jellyroll fold domain-containing protein n=1 Tax=Algibacter sp. TaxID=1872428 RepID=UPI0032982E5C
MKPTFRLFLSLACLLLVLSLQAQTCGGNTFVPPSAPSNCTYTYTSTGWQNAFGLPTIAPTSLSSSESICILVNYTGNFNFNVRGTFYVASGVKYTGQVSAFTSSSQILAAGEIDFTNTPSFSGLPITIGVDGIVSVPGDYAPGGSATIDNAGSFNIGGDLNLGGNASINNYPNAKVIVQGDSAMNAPFNNCGLFELVGSLSSGGSSGLNNFCSTYIHSDMNLNADYTNEGLLILDGTLNFTGSVFTNSNIMVVDNINLNNYSLIGDDKNSLLVVRKNATLSSNGVISGHLYYDIDDGGGFDSGCGGCTQDIDIVTSISLPSTNEELLANCGGDIIVNPFIEESKLDFDGVDDYVTTPNFINGISNVTIMAWVLSDSGNTTNMTIAGEDVGCRLWLQNGNKPTFTLKTAATTLKTISAATNINYDEWHHITGTFSSATGIMKLYVDGVFSTSVSVGATGSTIANVASNGNFEIGRRSTGSGSEYFKGDVDEVRVFNTTLTDSQIQRMVYQEIKNNDGDVKGKTINKNITDATTNATVSWSSLLAYYPLSNIISNTRTFDFSSFDRITKVRNITSFQDETAPIPYATQADGDWTSANTWLYGNVWDITNATSNKDWSIIEIKHNVTTSNSTKSIGLYIDANKTLTVQGDNLVENSWYLELNGTLDLEDDSQLIQTTTSDLVTSATGKILRRQEGTTCPFWYNYWGSPVGETGATSLSDNNTASNNANNAAFTLDMLKDGTGASMPFTSGYTGSGNISNYWLFTFKNGVTYYDWEQFSISTPIPPGVGYTQKGSGTTGTSQQYIFDGKPNNGTILVNVADVGGTGSVQNVSKTAYLLANPYPSALDIHKFIDDNIGVIEGNVELWQQWSGSSHVLDQYNGGYAQVNKTGTVRASQFIGVEGNDTGGLEGTKMPTRYLPVGQGFMVEIENNGVLPFDGTVEFNNSQRVFVKEADYSPTGPYDTGSLFSKSELVKNYKEKETEVDNGDEEPIMQKIRLEFSSTSGPDTKRELLLGFSDYTTDDYDYGYEAKNTTQKNNDLNLEFQGINMSIQAYGPITDDKIIPLNFRSSGDNGFVIGITETVNIEDGQAIYLHDNLTGAYFDLTQGTPYSFTSSPGIFNKRLELVFQNEQQSLSTQVSAFTENYMYYQNSTNTLFVKKLNSDVSRLSLINMRGQTILNLTDVSTTQLENGIPFNNVATGTYIVAMQTEANEVLTKKVIVK